MKLNQIEDCKKYLIQFLLVTLLIIALTPLKTVSQEISTVGEIYDYEIGDIFHFDLFCWGCVIDETKIQIINKYYSQNNDTLYYTRDIDHSEHG